MIEQAAVDTPLRGVLDASDWEKSLDLSCQHLLSWSLSPILLLMQ